MNKGIFIVFEGIEGSGKSTQINSILKHYTQKGLKVLSTREPGGTSLGNKIREVVLHETHPISSYAETFLMMAARAQHVEEIIKPALKTHDLIISDRYADSSIVYQGVGRNLPLDEIKNINHFATQHIYPIKTFLLDHDPKETLLRIKNRPSHNTDRFEQESLEFHIRIKDAYLKIASNNCQSYIVVDSRKSEKEITQTLIKHIDQILNNA